jgi:uncharacterized protein
MTLPSDTSPTALAPTPISGGPLQRIRGHRGGVGVGLVAGMLVFAIRVYQRTLSPLLPVVTMGRCGCRFAPTCSHYAAEAIRMHGAFVGAGLAVWRLLKCTPLHPGGFDPVPSRGALRCTRVDTASL